MSELPNRVEDVVRHEHEILAKIDDVIPDSVEEVLKKADDVLEKAVEMLPPKVVEEVEMRTCGAFGFVRRFLEYFATKRAVHAEASQ